MELHLKKTRRLFAVALLFSTFVHGQDEISVWVNKIRPIALQNMMRNFNPPGTARGVIVASPSRENPDYFYNWIRDAGLVMDVIISLYEQEEDVSRRRFYEQKIFDFLELTKYQQSTPNLSGGVGEPKFLVDGSPFMGPWGRPQDDGPAIRVINYTRLARFWLSQEKEWLIREKLYDGSWYSVAKVDLEYLSHHWQNTCVDLWEEVSGHHFFTRMVQRRALLEGADLADWMGDAHAADWYRKQGHLITTELERHWDAQKQAIVTTLDWKGGLKDKHSGLDTGVILGIIHGQTPQTPLFTVTDGRVLSTVAKIRDAFQNIYAINHQGHRGVAIGRYPEDTYDGYSSSGEGNPWFLTTHAMAELLYRGASEFEKTKEVRVTPTNLRFFQSLGLSKVRTGYKISQTQIATKMREQADDYLSVSQFHMDNNGSMSEQLNRDTGFMQGARDLTWSYASLITAIDHR